MSAPLPAAGPDVAADGYDPDHLLAGYRAARAQAALFDVRGGTGTGYDEFVDATGHVRPDVASVCRGHR